MPHNKELEKQISLRVIQIGAVVLTKVHELKRGEINRKEYNRQLDDILFPNITREILDLFNQQNTAARMEELENINFKPGEVISYTAKQDNFATGAAIIKDRIDERIKELQAKSPVEANHYICCACHLTSPHCSECKDYCESPVERQS